ncbi:hypothetical protein CPB85DRAFT_1213203 [Mucidula mucida]|nr:hypothetical protein CPB85DRAFT_1213203 [Mucidula mucida]
MSPAQEYLSPGRPDTIHLSGKPPSLRPGSPASSLYSDYSYYQFDGSPSPTGTSHFPHDTRNNTPSPQPRVTFKDNNSRSPSPGAMPISETNPTTPQDFLQLGITHHEANRLTDSASCFEKSATLQGGCGVGMLMWGLTLRHGWGCKKDEKNGFTWLRKAAELAVADLERMSGKQVDGKEGVRGELVLAIYEVGQCFFHGWGVKQDMKMGVSYYTTAARLGDPDAQNDLAFCLANGKGCKKDRKEAAAWYRKAVAQGVSEVGLAWIYKEKFQ